MRIKRVILIIFFTVMFFQMTACLSRKQNSSLKPTINESSINNTVSTNTPENNDEKRTKKINSGLLFALKDEKGKEKYGESSTYRTMWITCKETGELAVKSEGQDVLVPHGTGFWKISIEKHKTKTYNAEYLIANKANAKKPFIDIEERESTKIDKKQEIFFVGNNYICISDYMHGYEVGAAHGMGLKNIFVKDIEKINSYNNTLEDHSFTSIKDIIPDNKIDTLIEKLNKEKAPEGWFNPEMTNCNSWMIARESGKWKANIVKIIQLASSMIDYTINENSYDLPEQVTSHDDLLINFNEIKRQIPDAYDAISSPKKDLLVVFIPQKIMFFKFPQNELKNPDFELNIGKNESLIMCQWATGEYVDKWNEEISKIMK